MSFDAGALIFKIQTAGYQTFKQELAEADQAVKNVGRTSQEAKPKLEQLGTAQEETGKKARAAKQPLTEQAKATEDVGAKSRKASEEQQKQAVTAEQQAQAARQLSTALLAAGVAVAALVTLSVVKYAQFDAQMSNVRAATMATATEQKALGEAALQAGADTAYSATEAAAAQEELAKAGLGVANIVGGSLNGALALAAAGQLQVARSAEIMATTLKQFKLPGEQAAHVADILAAGAGKAQGGVDDLASALKFVGPVAASMGLALEETTGILALFAEQGIIGEQAGTSLRGVLSSLSSPSSIAAKTMKEYGIEIFTSSGKMKTGAAVAQELRDGLYGLSDAERSAALGRIFGNQSLTAATILMEGGASAVEKWTDAVNDSGYAAEQAAIRQDNLAGDIEKLGGAFETALIRTGSGANDVLRDMVQAVTGLVNIYGELDPVMQQGALIIGVAAAALLLLYGGGLKAAIALSELKRASDNLNISMKTTSLVAGGAAIAITGILTVVTMVAQAQAEARAKAKAYADTLEDGTRRITDATRDMIAENLTAENSFLWLSQGSAADAAEQLGVSLETVRDAIEGDSVALEELNGVIQKNLDEGLKPMKDANLEAYDSAVILKGAVKGEIGALDKAAEIAAQKNEITKDGVPVTQSAAEAYLDAADAAGDLESELRNLIDTINEANGVGQDAITANLDYRDTLAKVNEQIAKAKKGVDGYKATLDENTQAGRDNMAMLVNLAEDSQAAAKAQFDLDGNTEAYRKTLENGRQALIDRARDLGKNAEEAEALAGQIYRIPSETEWKLIADTKAAAEQVRTFIRTYDGKVITLQLKTSQVQVGDRVYGGLRSDHKDGSVVEFYAGGGMRENHVAQIARAGEYRVWAEPETGGESYIPHAPAKRARAEAVMVETAARLGGVYIPAGAARFADGGVTAPAGTASGTTFQFDIHAVPLPTAQELYDLMMEEAQWHSRQ